MQAYYSKKLEEAITIVDDLTSQIVTLKNDILDKVLEYKDSYGISLSAYQEFRNNEYITGELHQASKHIFQTVGKEHIDANLWDLYNLARTQKAIYDLKKDIEYYDKLIKLSIKEYTEILRIYYTEVERQMILNGAGYAFEGSLGWICINRCKIESKMPKINFRETTKNKERLLAEGKKIYNKEEAEWCKARGIEYDGVDPRVYLKEEYCYEIPLLDCKIPNGSKFRFVCADYRGNALRGKSNEEILDMADYNTEYICKLPLDLRAKLNLCNTADKTLYSKFIRNENQKPINSSKTRRKNRQ